MPISRPTARACAIWSAPWWNASPMSMTTAGARTASYNGPSSPRRTSCGRVRATGSGGDGSRYCSSRRRPARGCYCSGTTCADSTPATPPRPPSCARRSAAWSRSVPRTRACRASSPAYRRWWARSPSPSRPWPRMRRPPHARPGGPGQRDRSAACRAIGATRTLGGGPGVRPKRRGQDHQRCRCVQRARSAPRRDTGSRRDQPRI